MRVALVHDYLTQLGGAERVLEALHDLYPDALVFTSIADRERLPESWGDWDIRESPLRLAPGAGAWHRAVPPVYPALFASFRRALHEFDVILSDSSAWAHHAPAGPHAVHVCYCHSPARFLYGDRDYLGPAGVARPIRPVVAGTFSVLRSWDRRAASRVDQYVANSRAVAERIRRSYGREAPVVYPPVDVDRYAEVALGLPEAPGAWYVVVSRLVPHKRVDLALEAFGRLGIPLKVIGEGRSASKLRAVAPPNVELLGWLGDATTADVLARSRGLVLPAVEDFGMTAVEAQAAGRPVVAYGVGGALESVVPEETGVFFQEQTAASLIEAVRRCEAMTWDRARIQANAARFSVGRFQDEMAGMVETAWRVHGGRFARR